MTTLLQKTILDLLSSSLTGKEINVNNDGFNISELIFECQQQGILYLVLDRILPLCTDNRDKYSLIAYKVKHTRQLQSILSAQDELFTLLYDNGFHFVILKGLAAAQYYPNPENRTFGDIDVLFKKGEFQPAMDLVKSKGYGYRDKEENSTFDSHSALKKDGVVFEPHVCVSGLPEDSESRSYLESLFSAGIKEPVTKNLLGHDMPLFPELQNGLVLLLHIREHIKDGIGLRQLADWMVYVQNYLDDEAYENKWKEVLENSGLTQLAKLSTALCVKYLGLKGNYSWCADADMNTVDWMMDYIFDQGNFGHKKKQLDKGAKMLSETNGEFHLLKRLYNSGLGHWSNKHKTFNPKTTPILRNFAIFYGLGHYISELHKRGGIPYLIKSFIEARKRKIIFSNLGLFD